MNDDTREELDRYYAAAGSWADDRAAALTRSRRLAWMVAAAAGFIAMLEAFALFALAPLKTVIPYTLLVDRQTGFVEALKPLDAQRLTPDSALTRSFLVQYVIARESFDIDTVQSSYRSVALWSAETARSDYVAGMQATNPASPLAALPRSAIVDTRVKSVSPIGASAALVRFDTVRRDQGGEGPPRAWVAVIRYRFSVAPLSQADRFLNPLGFQVVRYRRDQETAPAEPSAPASAPTMAPAALRAPVQPVLAPVTPRAGRAAPAPGGFIPGVVYGPTPAGR